MALHSAPRHGRRPLSTRYTTRTLVVTRSCPSRKNLKRDKWRHHRGRRRRGALSRRRRPDGLEPAHRPSGRHRSAASGHHPDRLRGAHLRTTVPPVPTRSMRSTKATPPRWSGQRQPIQRAGSPEAASSRRGASQVFTRSARGMRGSISRAGRRALLAGWTRPSGVRLPLAQRLAGILKSGADARLPGRRSVTAAVQDDQHIKDTCRRTRIPPSSTTSRSSRWRSAAPAAGQMRQRDATPLHAGGDQH